jgi:predicted enzyme related to lactoylglutathione lyase
LVPEPKQAKNRVHIDLRTDNFEAELSRLVDLGAHEVDEQCNDDLIVLRDPEGNEFCLLRSA